VALLGKLSVRKRSCRTKQKVAIQRYQPTGKFYITIDVAVTNKKGSFVATVRPVPADTFLYRARVNQTKRCTGAVSNRVKVRAK
jgi:hypothetical protein